MGSNRFLIVGFIALIYPLIGVGNSLDDMGACLCFPEESFRSCITGVDEANGIGGQVSAVNVIGNPGVTGLGTALVLDGDGEGYGISY